MIFERFIISCLLAITVAGLGYCSKVHADGVAGWNYTTYYGGGASPSINNRTVDTTGITTSINYDWGGGLVLDSRLYDGVIIHFTGYLRAPTTGTYQFGVASDDGNQLTINNTVVTACWCEQGTTFRSGSIYLTAGQIVPADIWYYENGGGAAVQFYWYTNGSWQIVPTSMMATSASYWGPSVTGTGSGTITTTSTSGSITSTYSQPVTITYYSNGTQTTANNGNATLISTTDTGGSSTITSTQQQMINSIASRMPGLTNNSIYINQAGNGDTAKITQVGAGNVIDGATSTSNGPGYTTAAPITGGSNKITIRQHSNNNIIDLAAIGGNNTLNLNQGTDSNGNYTGLDQGGHYQFDYVNGSGNTVTVVQENTSLGAGQFSSLAVVGNLNTVGITQTGNARNQLFATVNGNSNSITTSQTGTSPGYINISASGNGNSAVVNQSNTGASGNNNASITLINNGAPASVNLTQTGGQNYSVTQSCVTTCGTITVKQGN